MLAFELKLCKGLRLLPATGEDQAGGTITDML